MSLGKRRQRYVLDRDDLIRAAVFSRPNAENVLNGLNQSEAGNSLGIGVGGTGAKMYNDQELIIYDAASNQLRSSGVRLSDLQVPDVEQPPYMGDIGAAWHTGLIYVPGSVNTSDALTTDEMVVMSASSDLPPNTIWVAYRVEFSFYIQKSDVLQTGSAVNSITVRINESSMEPEGCVTTYSGPFTLADSVESYLVTWTAEGVMPSAHAYDETISFSVLMQGGFGDMPSYRKGYLRLETRGAEANVVPTPISGRVVFTAPTIFYQASGGPTATYTDWRTFTCNMVPEGASAVILAFYGNANGPDNGSYGPAYLYVRAESGRTQYRVGGLMAAGGSDSIGNASSCICAFKSTPDQRSFQYKFSNGGGKGVNGTVVGHMIGYIS